MKTDGSGSAPNERSVLGIVAAYLLVVAAGVALWMRVGTWPDEVHTAYGRFTIVAMPLAAIAGLFTRLPPIHVAVALLAGSVFLTPFTTATGHEGGFSLIGLIYAGLMGVILASFAFGVRWRWRLHQRLGRWDRYPAAIAIGVAACATAVWASIVWWPRPAEVAAASLEELDLRHFRVVSRSAHGTVSVLDPPSVSWRLTTSLSPERACSELARALRAAGFQIRRDGDNFSWPPPDRSLCALRTYARLADEHQQVHIYSGRQTINGEELFHLRAAVTPRWYEDV